MNHIAKKSKVKRGVHVLARLIHRAAAKRSFASPQLVKTTAVEASVVEGFPPMAIRRVSR
jgi:hypothetical protein